MGIPGENKYRGESRFDIGDRVTRGRRRGVVRSMAKGADGFIYRVLWDGEKNYDYLKESDLRRSRK